MGDYHDLYLKTDVLIFADVFENFRKTSMQYYNLDPSHYFSSPGFALDAMLKMTGASLELITDIDMYLMEKGHCAEAEGGGGGGGRGAGAGGGS